MKFTAAYSGSTLCSPSRAAIMSGCSPARLHLTDWIPGQQQINRKSLVPDWKTYIDKGYADDGKVELYQLADDPMEQINLAGQNPGKAQEMEQEMRKMLEGVYYQPVLANLITTPINFPANP